MIRVISGRYKGKRLKKVPGMNVRPMPDKLKEALFNVLQEDIRGTRWLDGFAGTGSVGIEALSRGAEEVVFVDEYYPAVKVIKANLAKCDEEAEEKGRVMHREFNRAVIQLAKEKRSFDVIFLDPPYRLLDERNPLKVIKKRGILREKGIVLLRHHFKSKFEARYFSPFRKLRLGDDVITFYK
ncbi:MAG: 16S rRNA (guanine(966)-N(2))-methyltransferase RsmD [Candidatus Hydrothermarchaeota archaeon]